MHFCPEGEGETKCTTESLTPKPVICMVTKDLTDRYHAGEIIKNLSKIAGGKGGGKPDMAQGGTKDVEKLDTALSSLPDIIKAQAKG